MATWDAVFKLEDADPSPRETASQKKGQWNRENPAIRGESKRPKVPSEARSSAPTDLQLVLDMISEIKKDFDRVWLRSACLATDTLATE